MAYLLYHPHGLWSKWQDILENLSDKIFHFQMILYFNWYTKQRQSWSDKRVIFILLNCTVLSFWLSFLECLFFLLYIQLNIRRILHVQKYKSVLQSYDVIFAHHIKWKILKKWDILSNIRTVYRVKLIRSSNEKNRSVWYIRWSHKHS